MATSANTGSERTLGDVSIDRRWIELLCRMCLHCVEMPAWDVPGWPDLTLAELQKRSRCQQCGSDVVRIEELIACEKMFEGMQTNADAK